MKRFLFLMLCLLNVCAAQASLRHAEYRWRNDDGDEASATWKAASNTPIFVEDMDEVLRLRYEFDNDNGSGMSSVVDHYLWYSKDGGSSWVQITNSDLNDFQMVNSDNVTHGTPSTNLMGTGLGTFAGGFVISDELPDLSTLINDGQRLEMEWVIKPTIHCENFTTYLFEMSYWETSGVQAQLTTNFDCEEPVVTVATSFERCGPGTFILEAEVDMEDALIYWWDSPTGGILVGTGTSFETSVISTSTTVYAEGFHDGCTSDRIPVELYVRDVPTIDIPLADGSHCAEPNELSIVSTPAQPEGTTYLWHNGATTPNIVLPANALSMQDVWVEVTNQWGCTASDSVKIIINPSPLVNLGPDQTVCEGGVVTLDAGNEGSSFYWNTGATTREITIEDGGTYAVLVTNEYGCANTDTIQVNVEGFAPSVLGIQVDHISESRFQFTPIGPEHVTAYAWDFGDGTPPSVMEAPDHYYEEPGTYLVTLEVQSSCGSREYFTYTTVVLGIDDVLVDARLKVYPNPANNSVQVSTEHQTLIETVRVINGLGHEVLVHQAGATNLTSVDLSTLPSGNYFLQIKTNKGSAVQRLQIVH